jgi:pimeloyl-ACP methyl ester carboxylesterase
MTQKTAFKTPEGEAAYFEAYEAAMKLWPVPYEEIEVQTRFGMTHVVTSGPKNASPLVLLHGMLATSTMWSPNIADFSKEYRVYAIDVITQPGKSILDPDEPVRDETDFVAWLSATLDGLNLDRVFLVGMSYGGWLALNLAMTAPERVQKLVLLSPAASFQPLSRLFSLGMMPVVFFPTRLTVNSYFGWMGVKDPAGDPVARNILDLAYLGLKHFRFPPETARIKLDVYSDDELCLLPMPVLLLIGENEVIYDAAKALDRARQFIPNIEGELVPDCGHEMSASQHRIVDARVLEFLMEN